MEVQPASLDQFLRGRDGRVHLIDADVGGVAAELRRIHPQLKLRYNETGEYYAVLYESEDRRESYLILTAQDCDHRIVDRIQRVDGHGRSGYDYAKELEKGSVEAKRRAHERLMEHVAETAPAAMHALRKDLGFKGRAFIPRGLPAA